MAKSPSIELLHGLRVLRTPQSLPWWVPLLLALPALIPLAQACLSPLLHGQVATGFTQADQPYYLANGREYFDAGFHLSYGNPYASYSTPRIYSQPHLFALGALQFVGLDPGIAFAVFAFTAMVFASWVAATFYGETVGYQTRAKRIGLLCFFWGGGVLSLAGVAAGIIKHRELARSIWRFDPSNGWWMLNFGRNLVSPTEAYYHGLFLLALLLLIRRKFSFVLLVVAVMSASHPFTGLTLALIVTAYAALETVLGSRAASPLLLCGGAAILLGHIGYYLLFLGRFADHRALRSQWELSWTYPPSTYLFSLFLVGSLAAYRIWRITGVRKTFTDPRARLFGVWFLVVFALSQHNLVVKPMQPIHFTHGYDWMALFFLAAPALLLLLDRLLVLRPAVLRAAAVTCLITLLLLDNAIWLGSFFFSAPVSEAITLTKEQKAVLQWLDKNSAPPDIVVAQDMSVSYLVATYTRVRSWQGHSYNTPSFQQRHAEVERVFAQNELLPIVDQSHVLYVAPRNSHWQPPVEAGLVERYQNSQFIVWGKR